MTVIWHQQYTNMLANSGLSVTEHNGGLLLPSDAGLRKQLRQPVVIGETKYEPDLSRAREYGWKRQ